MAQRELTHCSSILGYFHAREQFQMTRLCEHHTICPGHL